MNADYRPRWLAEKLRGGRGVLRWSSGSRAHGISDFRLFRGALPPVSYLKEPSQVADWWRGYTRAYLEWDLRDISQISSLSNFCKVMALLASSSSQILNQTSIAGTAAVSQAKAGHYIGLLEITGLFVRLFPYGKNIRKRVRSLPRSIAST
jgi:predicted AAA+ superfamily ATPase